MGSLSDYAEKKILDHVFGKTAYTMPAVYLALSTADPLDAGTGMAEPSGNAYARKTTAGSDWNAATGTTATVTNATSISFPVATGSWGTITHFALFDAPTAGNLIAHGALSASKAIASGDMLLFSAGAISATFD